MDIKKLNKLLAEAEALQTQYAGKAMPPEIGEKFDALCTEAKALQDAGDEEKQTREREQRLESMRKFSREVPDPILPAAPSEKSAENGKIAGFITVGSLFARSPEFAQYVKQGMPLAGSLPMATKNLQRIRGSALNVDGLIALTEAEIKTLPALRLESKAETIPDFGSQASNTDVIPVNRVDRFVQDTRPDVLTLRDVMNVSPTSSPVIDYIAEVSYTEAAAIVSEGSTKPYAAIKFERRRANVVTIAVWMPVTEQQLQDAPALINRIDARLLWDIKKAEEQQIAYGDGSNENFTGLFDSGSGISAMRTGTTLLDTIRMGITDVRTSGYNPNALLIHPEDWETIELLRGSDGHYVWAVIRDLLGPRVWGLRVVESVGTRKAGDTTTNMAVGDFQAGATLYDRQQSNIRMGWKDDDFIKNMRTILAEERVAFALEAPAAFRIFETAS